MHIRELTVLVGSLAFFIHSLLYLDLVLNIVYQGLQTKDLSSVSAESLQKVCTACQKKMAHHFSILLQIVQAIDSLSISTGAVLEFFQGTVHVNCEVNYVVLVVTVIQVLVVLAFLFHHWKNIACLSEV